ncbi:MAG: lysylphosphatidylglycerol synthase transmembrane domain-containing protein [Bacteroidales bacterium]|nr:lysylphosphatidylglycerol synthase transmembrane domain-containing protein [Bacteroidales bacterium]
MKKHIINAVTGIVIASIFLFLTLRNKPLDEIFSLIKEARLNWILLSVGMLVIVFILRSLRWKLILNNTGTRPRFQDVAYSYLLGVFVNSFTPKLGEVIRCTSLEKSSGIETSKSLGTVISERIYDLLALIIGIIIILFIESDRLGSLVTGAFRGLFVSIGNNAASIVLFSAGGVLLIALIWFGAKKIGFAAKVKDFFKGVASTARMTFRIKNSRNFALQTILIWAVMVLMNFAVLKSLPSTDSLSLYFAMVSLFIGTIGWAIPTPGGIGTSHFFVLQLFILFNLNEETGIAYAVLVNGLQVVFTILAGFIAVAVVSIIRFINQNKEHKAVV